MSAQPSSIHGETSLAPYEGYRLDRMSAQPSNFHGETLLAQQINADPESSTLANRFNFDERKIRHRFIAKVYAILSVQLLVTGVIISVFLAVPQINDYFRRGNNEWLFILIWTIGVIFVIILACFKSIRRWFPLNIIMLFSFTLIEGAMLGCISSRYSTEAVMIAASMTMVTTVGLSAFALQTRIDFSGCGAFVFCILLELVVFGIFAGVFHNRLLTIAYSSAGSILFSLYLIIDTQLTFGWKNKMGISEEDYIFCALNLYLDIVNIFLYLLSCLSSK